MNKRSRFLMEVFSVNKYQKVLFKPLVKAIDYSENFTLFVLAISVYGCSVWFYCCSLVLRFSVIPGDFWWWGIPSQHFCAGGFCQGNAPYQEWNKTSLVQNLRAVRRRLFNGMYVLYSCTKVHLLLLHITRQMWLIRIFDWKVGV